MANKKITKPAPQEQKAKLPQDKNKEGENRMPLTWYNYKLMLIGLAVIVLGLILMAGPRNPDPNVFDESMFNFRRITLAPILVLAGFGFEIYAIMKRPGKKNNKETDDK